MAGFGVTLAWDPATDDHGADFVRYNVYATTTGLAAARFVAGEQLGGAIVCSGASSSGIPGMGVALKGTYRVRAVDAAGNEDQNSATLVVEKMCPLNTDGGSTDAARDQSSDQGDEPVDPPRSDAPVPTADGPTPTPDQMTPADAPLDQSPRDGSHEPPIEPDAPTGTADAGSDAAADSSTHVDAASSPIPTPGSEDTDRDSCSCSIPGAHRSNAIGPFALFGVLLAWVRGISRPRRRRASVLPCERSL